MLPPVASILLVGQPGSTAHTIALEAIGHSHPGVPVRQAADLGDALALPVASPELLVLLNPQSGDISRASAATDPRGLSRWSVVARGASSTGSRTPFFGVGADDWGTPVLAHALTSATTMHLLERENARLRGDLRTVSRRLAHDLRTPLNCISTASEALRDPSAGFGSAAPFAQSIADSIDETVSLIERLNLVLKATADPVKLQTVTMEEIVWGTLQRLERRIQRANAVVTKPRLWPAVEGVPVLIDLIWVNLIHNSLQHAGPRPRIELGWERTNGEHRFWLRDSGKGIAPDRLGHLFYPLDRLNDLNAPRGYGLPIIHRLTELQGGRCGYDRLPAPGGTFFFTLRTA